ncbi:MAG: DUF3575 domain-containing protein [Flavobacterium circumlabens]|uniref:DUF3575 domain-containing protein n=1 Tax=Flavobacterium circumlabens TaxID=2133765 RepID=UPI0032674F14
MKKILSVIILFSAFLASAQNEINDNLYEKNNEITFNALGLLNGTIQVTFERHLNKKSSLGITSTYVFSNNINDDLNYSVSPYYRRYFGKKYAAGFFVEGFGMLTSIDGKKIYNSDDHSIFTENPDVTDFALGAGLGWKWVSKGGFLIEANMGYGALLFNANKTDHNIVNKIMLNVGYRF